MAPPYKIPDNKLVDLTKSNKKGRRISVELDEAVPKKLTPNKTRKDFDEYWDRIF